jgi:hypothetical protein
MRAVVAQLRLAAAHAGFDSLSDWTNSLILVISSRVENGLVT